MPTDNGHWNAAWAAWLVEELVRHCARTFFISPGSRSTPLTVAAARNPQAKTIVHFDERGAGFMAVGHAKATGVPAVLICTSGTAAANYLPAIVEAAQSNTPLVVLTADRPLELVDAGANQTIDQTRIYGAYTRWHAELPCPGPDTPAAFVLTTAAQAVYRAMHAPAGPVHVNCRFREPLSPNGQADKVLSPPELEAWTTSDRPYTRYPIAPQRPSDNAIDSLREVLSRTQRGMLVIGSLHNDAERGTARALAHALTWPTCADVTSGLRLGHADPPFVAHYPLLLASGYLAGQATPDTVLHIGGAITSKRLQHYLRDIRPRDYALIANHPKRIDPDHGVALRIEGGIAHACHALAQMPTGTRDDDWARALFSASASAGKCLVEHLDTCPELNEPVVARLLSRHIPAGTALFLGNSMPVRDMDTFADARGASVPVFANRGASGIDGTLATAAGIAIGQNAPVVAVLGDLAVLHDLNSLALLKQAPVILVVINNDGGGIFEFLPVAAQEDVFELYFATPHGLGFQHAARMFGIDYAAPKDSAQFTRAFTEALARGHSAIIEVIADRSENTRRHTAVEEAVRRTVGR